MKAWARRIGFFLALGFLVLTFVNASWLADAPGGTVQLVAHRGLMQLPARPGSTRDGCDARQIEAPFHNYIENTVPAIDQAWRVGAQMIALDLAPTADGNFALFGDKTLDCRTDGQGPVADKTLAQLRSLDAGYGYSADGGKTFPLRGKGKGLIASLGEGLAAARSAAVLYNLHFDDPALADRLVALLKASGRDPLANHDAFSGPEAVLARVRTAFPGVWAFNQASIEACTRDYLIDGWFAITPKSCANGTIAVPLDRQWAFAGWPDRLAARMDAVGARVILIAPWQGGAAQGLDLPEQIGEIPMSFTGHVLVDDIWSVGPALRPAYNKRNPYQEEKLGKALEARRAARD